MPPPAFHVCSAPQHGCCLRLVTLEICCGCSVDILCCKPPRFSQSQWRQLVGFWLPRATSPTPFGYAGAQVTGSEPSFSASVRHTESASAAAPVVLSIERPAISSFTATNALFEQNDVSRRQAAAVVQPTTEDPASAARKQLAGPPRTIQQEDPAAPGTDVAAIVEQPVSSSAAGTGSNGAADGAETAPADTGDHRMAAAGNGGALCNVVNKASAR